MCALLVLAFASGSCAHAPEDAGGAETGDLSARRPDPAKEALYGPGAPSWLTEDDYQNHVEQLELIAELSEYTEEPPEIVRWIRPDEVFDVRGSCYEEQGFGLDADPVRNSAAAVGKDGTRGEAEYHAEWICQAKYPVMPGREHSDLSDRTKRILYDYVVEELIPCLREHGYEGSYDDLPSYEAYWERMDTDSPWLAYNEELTAWSYEEGIDIEAFCPQEPNDGRLDYLYEEQE